MKTFSDKGKLKTFVTNRLEDDSIKEGNSLNRNNTLKENNYGVLEIRKNRKTCNIGTCNI